MGEWVSQDRMAAWPIPCNELLLFSLQTAMSFYLDYALMKTLKK